MAKLVHPKGQLKKYYIFSPFLRIFHWIMVWCIAGLFITGLLIMDPISGGPGHEPTFADWRLSVDLIRNIHFLLGFIFTASFTFVINHSSSCMSGHVEGSRAFNRYRMIDDDMKRRLVDMID